MTREQALKALELHSGASPQEIKQAYRDLALVWHPDRFAHHGARLQEKASERFKEINTAYDALRSYDDSPSKTHGSTTKHTGSKDSASGTEQSETRRQNGARPSAKQTESLIRPWVVIAALIFVVVIAGLLNDRPTGEESFDSLDNQSSRDAKKREQIDLLSLLRKDSQPEERTGDLLQFDQLTTRPDEIGSPTADTVTSSPVDLAMAPAYPIVAVREPEADASRSSNPFNPNNPQGSQDSLPQEPIDLLSLSGGDSRTGEQTKDLVQSYRSTTPLDEVESPAANTVESSPVDLAIDPAEPVLDLREPEAGALGSSSLYFTRGSHRDDVLRIQGTPSSISRYPNLGHEVWRYGSSSVNISLRDGRVTEWTNRGNLRVRMGAGPQ